MKKIVRIPLLVAGVIVALAACVGAIGFAYNEVSIVSLRAQAGLRGRLYQVDGHNMHLYCSGRGAPTVVLSSGLGDDSLVWSRTQAALSATTRVCSYDRAGLGWSDSRPETADAKNVAIELHDLVHAASIATPFVLAGHSISGVYIREYAQLYGHDLAALEFIDGSTPLQDPLFPAVYAEIDRERRREAGRELATMTLGLDRLQRQCSQQLPGFEAYARWFLADACIPGHFVQADRELDAVPQSGEETIRSGPFGSLPILIFSRDPNVRRTDMPAGDARTGSLLWDQLQERLTRLSTRSRRIIALHSDHYIFLDREELVIRELKRFIEQLRANSAPAEPYGSTISE
jgi:pimeloyl-ACP methyl ester carboxylesterase